MDKKVISALFKNAVSHEEIRPIMNGVHFEKDRCYGSDGHILVVYKKSDKRFDGKTIAENGEEIEGYYPNIDPVFPEEDTKHENYVIDAEQLHSACQWHCRKMDSDDGDLVVINDVGYNIKLLNRLLNIIESAGHQPKLTFMVYGATSPVMVKSKDMKSIIMPSNYGDEYIDMKRELGDPVVYSYENFINEYVFNSWKKSEVKKPLSWLD